MSLDVFPFSMHTVTHTYPKGDSVKFGKGYEFNAKPLLPFQRTFHLYFSAMQWFFNADGSLDTTSNPSFNMGALVQFFEAHDYSQAFTYPHPIYGDITVKFAAGTAFEIPKSLPGGSGVTEPLQVDLVEQPT